MFMLLVSAVFQQAYAQKPCDQITPAILTAAGVPSVTKLGGSGCRFLTAAKWRRQSDPGELDIIPAKVTSASPAVFDKLQDEWFAQHGRRCGLELGLGKKAAWCGTGSVTSLDYALLILRGDVISEIVLHNWIQAPNPSRDMAMRLAQDVFGPSSEEAPLVRPKD
jgi:hypothetical protein